MVRQARIAFKITLCVLFVLILCKVCTAGDLVFIEREDAPHLSCPSHSDLAESALKNLLQWSFKQDVFSIMMTGKAVTELACRVDRHRSKYLHGKNKNWENSAKEATIIIDKILGDNLPQFTRAYMTQLVNFGGIFTEIARTFQSSLDSMVDDMTDKIAKLLKAYSEANTNEFSRARIRVQMRSGPTLHTPFFVVPLVEQIFANRCADESLELFISMFKTEDDAINAAARLVADQDNSCKLQVTRALENTPRPATGAIPAQDIELGEKLVLEGESSWVKMKEMYSHNINGWGGTSGKMSVVNRFRKAWVDNVLASVIAYVHCLYADRFIDIPGSGGSTDYTSDYDVTVTGETAAQVVIHFNQLFRSYWGFEAGTVFDTNIYTSNYAERRRHRFFNLFQKSDNPNPAPEPSKAYQMALNIVMDRFSLAQLRLYTDPKLFSKIAERVSSEMKGECNQINTFHSFEAADSLARSFIKWKFVNLRKESKVTLPQKIMELDPNAASYETLLEAVQTIVSNSPRGSDLELAVSNRMYEKILLKLFWLSEQKVKEEDKDGHILRMHILMGYSLMFANEAYFTYGAVSYIALNSQLNRKIWLDKSLMLQAFNEQIGCVFKDFHHFDTPVSKLVHSSKYMHRAIDAASALRTSITHNFELFFEDTRKKTTRSDLQTFDLPPLTEKLHDMATNLLLIRRLKGKYAVMSNEERDNEALMVAQQPFKLPYKSSPSDIFAQVKKALIDYFVIVNQKARTYEAAQTCVKGSPIQFPMVHLDIISKQDLEDLFKQSVPKRQLPVNTVPLLEVPTKKFIKHRPTLSFNQPPQLSVPPQRARSLSSPPSPDGVAPISGSNLVTSSKPSHVPPSQHKVPKSTSNLKPPKPRHGRSLSSGSDTF